MAICDWKYKNWSFETVIWVFVRFRNEDFWKLWVQIDMRTRISEWCRIYFPTSFRSCFRSSLLKLLFCLVVESPTSFRRRCWNFHGETPPYFRSKFCFWVWNNEFGFRIWICVNLGFCWFFGFVRICLFKVIKLWLNCWCEECQWEEEIEVGFWIREKKKIREVLRFGFRKEEEEERWKKGVITHMFVLIKGKTIHSRVFSQSACVTSLITIYLSKKTWLGPNYKWLIFAVTN